MKNARAVLTVVALLLVAPHIRPVAAGPNSHIDEAASAFATLEFEKALALLDKALESKGNLPMDLVRIYSLKGLCLVSLGRAKEAEHAFRAALSIDPGYRLPPDLSPRFQQPFQKVLDAGVKRIEARIDVPTRIVAGDPLIAKVRLLEDPEHLVSSVVFHYRAGGQKKYSSVSSSLAFGRPAHLRVPSSLLPAGPAVIEWYAELLDLHGGRLGGRADPEHPLVIRLEPPPAVAEPPATAGVAVEQPAKPWWRKWWIWAIAGGVVVAAGASTAAIVLGGSGASQRNFGVEIR